jgi:hypothetical protein
MSLSRREFTTEFCFESMPKIYRLRKPYFESKTKSEARASGREPWAFRTGQVLLVRIVFWNFLQGRPDASRIRPDTQITEFFLSFPMKPISSQSDI